MKKDKIIAIFILITLLTILIVIPEGLSISIKKENKSNESEKTGIQIVNVGEMIVIGTGNHETSIVNASSEKNLKINVGLKGSDVLLEVMYDLYCPGLLDSAYAKLWVNNGKENEVDTDTYAQGYFFVLVEDCKIGDLIYWTLTVIYDDLLFPYPLFDFDDGSAFCRLSVSRFGLLNLVNRGLTLIGKIICK
jgi:hypothetical protein